MRTSLSALAELMVRIQSPPAESRQSIGFLSGCLGVKACALRSRTDSVGEVLYAVRDLGTGPQPGDLSDPLGNDPMLAAAGRRAAIMQRGLAAAAASLRGRNAGALST